MKKLLLFSTTFILLSTTFSSCKTFTKTDFDKIEDIETSRVEFLEYPKQNLAKDEYGEIIREKDGSVYYPIDYLPKPRYLWKPNGHHSRLIISYPKIYVRISPEVLFKHEQRLWKTAEDRSCFEFPIKKLSGWVGEAKYVPIDRCVRSEKIPFDSARKELLWFAKNFKWRVEWD